MDKHLQLMGSSSVRGEQKSTKRKALEPISNTEAKISKEVASTPEIGTNSIDSVFALPSSNEWNFKISSWNVAGLRAFVKKPDGMTFFQGDNPDIICLQEIKCLPEEVPDEAKFDGYFKYWLGKPGGHAGVALYSKSMPNEVTYGINDEEMDNEGRVITGEFSKFYVVCVYVPNSGRKLVNLEKRLKWDTLFQQYLNALNNKKPVIVCGDMNVAHLEIDLANPKTNKRNAGFTDEEREGMTNLLKAGFVDTFRDRYPNRTNAYTFWTYMQNARGKNVGWRLDYFIVSERFNKHVVDNVIQSKIMGSDHCPITLLLNV